MAKTTTKNRSVAAGTYLKGPKHSEGGIPVINKSDPATPIEVEGGEVVITAPAVEDNTKREFEGKMMTNRQILSHINQSGGGVKLAKGGEMKVRCTGKKYNLGGEMITDYEIAEGCGCKHKTPKPPKGGLMENGGETDSIQWRNTPSPVIASKEKQERAGVRSKMAQDVDVTAKALEDNTKVKNKIFKKHVGLIFSELKKGEIINSKDVLMYIAKMHKPIYGGHADVSFFKKFTDKNKSYIVKEVSIDSDELSHKDTDIDDDKVENYLQLLHKRKKFPPIVYDENGEILDGLHRAKAALLSDNFIMALIPSDKSNFKPISQIISEQYHKEKADGYNVGLVRDVEDAIGKKLSKGGNINSLLDELASLPTEKSFVLNSYKGHPDQLLAFIQEQATGMPASRKTATGDTAYNHLITFIPKDLVLKSVSAIPADQRMMIAKSWKGLKMPAELRQAVKAGVMADGGKISDKKKYTYSELQQKFPSKTHYVTTIEADNIVNGTTTKYAVVATKTGDKNKFGGDIYEDEELYFVLIEPYAYQQVKKPYKNRMAEGGNVSALWIKGEDNDGFAKVQNVDGYKSSKLIITKDGVKAKRTSKFNTPLGGNSVGYELKYTTLEEAKEMEGKWLNDFYEKKLAEGGTIGNIKDELPIFNTLDLRSRDYKLLNSRVEFTPTQSFKEGGEIETPKIQPKDWLIDVPAIEKRIVELKEEAEQAYEANKKIKTGTDYGVRNEYVIANYNYYTEKQNNPEVAAKLKKHIKSSFFEPNSYANYSLSNIIPYRKVYKKINASNYFIATEVDFVEVPTEGNVFDFWKKMCEKNTCKQSPKSSSQYIVTDEGVYRFSDHWGYVASCDWDLVDKDGNYIGGNNIGFAKWEDFKLHGSGYPYYADAPDYYKLKVDNMLIEVENYITQLRMVRTKKTLREKWKNVINRLLYDVQTIINGKYQSFITEFKPEELAKGGEISTLSHGGIIENSKGKLYYFVDTDSYANENSKPYHIKTVLPKVSKEDYYLSTLAVFEHISLNEYQEIDAVENISESGATRRHGAGISKYKIKDGIVYRCSNHWGTVGTCIWVYAPYYEKPFFNEHNIWVVCNNPSFFNEELKKEAADRGEPEGRLRNQVNKGYAHVDGERIFKEKDNGVWVISGKCKLSDFERINRKGVYVFDDFNNPVLAEMEGYKNQSDISYHQRQVDFEQNINPISFAKGGTIKDKVTAAEKYLKDMKTHTELRQWAISQDMDNRSAFPKFKEALKTIGLDYDLIKTGVHKQSAEELEQKINYQVTLYVDAKASANKFGITDKDGNVLWYGRFFDEDDAGEQSRAELAAAKKAVWLASKIKEAISQDAIELTLFVDAQWLTYQDHGGQKGYALTHLARKYNIKLSVEWIPGKDNPADEWTTASGYKKWSDNNLKLLAEAVEGKEVAAVETLPDIKVETKTPQQKAVKVFGHWEEYDKSYGLSVMLSEYVSDQAIRRKLFLPKKLVIEKTDSYLVVPEWIFDKKIEEIKEEAATGSFSARTMTVEVDIERLWTEKKSGESVETPDDNLKANHNYELNANVVDNEGNKSDETSKIISAKYSNAFELNKAIEKLLDSNAPLGVGGKEFIKYYSGYGGLEKYGAEGKGLLYEYYTPSKIAEKMWGLVYKYGFKGGDVLEPAAGIGEFVKYAPDQNKVTAYEINPYSARILKILYPQVTVHTTYFEELFILNRNTIKSKISGLKKYDLVIGNPPYGEFAGKFAGMGERDYTRAGNYIDYFIFRGLDLLKPGGLLCFIVGAEVAAGGKCFLSQQMNACKKEIEENAELLDAYRLPNGVFERTDVLSDIIVLRKK